MGMHDVLRYGVGAVEGVLCPLARTMHRWGESLRTVRNDYFMNHEPWLIKLLLWIEASSQFVRTGTENEHGVEYK